MEHSGFEPLTPTLPVLNVEIIQHYQQAASTEKSTETTLLHHQALSSTNIIMLKTMLHNNYKNIIISFCLIICHCIKCKNCN